jgi:pyruvate dehydrogenase E2 component (dihydrolipoamide acetyltransferase)
VFIDNFVSSAIPVLVIWGSEDRIIPVTHAQNLPAAEAAGIQVEIFESAGHMVQMEKASEVNRCLLNFLN